LIGRVLVTGGGGFIGSRVVKRLIDDGWEVVLVGPDLGAAETTARFVREGRASFVRCDPATGRAELQRHLGGGERLLLLGYEFPSATTVAGRLSSELNSNVVPTAQLLETCAGAVRHVVVASSAAVYGFPDHVPVAESALPHPRTPYAIAKVALEDAVRALALSTGATAAILRFGTVFGPGETVPRAIPNFIRRALAGERLCVEGDGLDESDYIFVDDVVEATMRVIGAPVDGTYNVGTGVGTTTLTVARLVLSLTDSASDVEFVAPRFPHARSRMVLATERARNELGFVAWPALRTGVQAEIGWFRERLGPSMIPAISHLAGVMNTE
jgi:UDP-glucose 4-epimerase